LPEQCGEIEQLRREIARALVKGQGEGGVEQQRRLKDAGVSYSDLQNDVRKTLALNLLENETLALAEIAFSLGYSEVSAFNHAFRRWIGQSPGDYRRLRAVHFQMRRSEDVGAARQSMMTFLRIVITL
jgi:methylphosphotriester-DNA--protein-cysteine methyltransferase